MENQISFSITNDTIMVVVDNKTTIVQRGSSNFLPLREALLREDWAAVPLHLDSRKSLAEWARAPFLLIDGKMTYRQIPVDATLVKRMEAMAAEGESPAPLFAFWERLQRNPSYRSVNQLWAFLNQLGIPLTEDGCFLAYKGVDADFKDRYTHKIDNTPGCVNRMERNLVSDDPDVACHYGYHVGALEYALKYARNGRIVICKVDPADVVCVPNDHHFQKMRVCAYSVHGHYTGPMSSTVIEDEPEYDEDLEEEDLDLDDEDDELLDEDDEDEEPVGKTFKQAVADGDLAESDRLSDVVAKGFALKLVKTEDSVEALDSLTATKKVVRKWAKLHTMGWMELMKEPIAKLRAYAGHGLKMTGASKIPGGKASLISRIMKFRAQ